MSDEKQIEEMAKALTHYEYKLCERLPKDKCLLASATHAQVSCDYCKIAEFLYNAGYRKQREGYWEIVKGSNGKEKMVCTNCRHQQDLASTFTYCPNCGAKMKGGAE